MKYKKHVYFADAPRCGALCECFKNLKTVVDTVRIEENYHA